jgi:CBS domain-containing protein
METHLISVAPDTPLLDVHRLLTEEEISGAPVIQEDGMLVGVITSTDLLRVVGEEHDAGAVATSYFRDLLPYSSPDWSNVPEDFQDRLSELRVEDAMTPDVVTIEPDATASEVARTLRGHHVHRVFVVEDQRLLGVISAFDVLRLVEEWKGA